MAAILSGAAAPVERDASVRRAVPPSLSFGIDDGKKAQVGSRWCDPGRAVPRGGSWPRARPGGRREYRSEIAGADQGARRIVDENQIVDGELQLAQKTFKWRARHIHEVESPGKFDQLRSEPSGASLKKYRSAFSPGRAP